MKETSEAAIELRRDLREIQETVRVFQDVSGYLHPPVIYSEATGQQYDYSAEKAESPMTASDNDALVTKVSAMEAMQRVEKASIELEARKEEYDRRAEAVLNNLAAMQEKVVAKMKRLGMRIPKDMWQPHRTKEKAEPLAEDVSVAVEDVKPKRAYKQRKKTSRKK